MTTATETVDRELRVWPAVVALVLLVPVRFGLPLVAADTAIPTLLAGLVGSLVAVVWWAFFSRAHWGERICAIVLMTAGVLVARELLDKSLATAGMGIFFFLMAVPAAAIGLVSWSLVTRGMPDRVRRVTMVAALVAASGFWVFLRTDGVSGSGGWDLSWRWAETREGLLVAESALLSDDLASGVVVAPEADWPGFRGARRDGVVSGPRIATDWDNIGPTQLWHREVGPGWSSFSVAGDLIYTQEQRGEEEIVACYRASTGEPVWQHRDEARFWEAQGGAGPRGTPTLSEGFVYALGATGIVNALDARDGAVVWSRDVEADSGSVMPYWGFAGSPWAIDDVVVVGASGRLIAYEKETGEPRWLIHEGTGYSSPHLATIAGVEQIVFLSSAGAIGVSPDDGTVHWRHAGGGEPIVQPGLSDDGGVFVAATGMTGGAELVRLAVAHGPSGWSVEEAWSTRGLKPYFSDFVVHEGYAYGFDGSLLSSIDLSDGQRAWKGGRYGHGQLVLLADQDLLLVVTEKGELALVRSSPDRFEEVARAPGIEGKTWNHPVLVGDRLYLRNSQEMAAFRLPLQ